MKKYSKFFVLVIISGLVLSSSVFAQTSTSTATSTTTSTSTLSALQAMIVQLEQQIKALKEQLSQLEIQTKAVKEELKIARNLQYGSTGDDVKELQSFLKEFSEIYPEGLVTGYFGPLTRSAVKKFQVKYELEDSGEVDEYTIKKLKLVFEGAGKSGKTPYGLLIAPGIAKKIDIGTSSIITNILPYGIAKKIEKEWKKDKDHDDDDNDDCDDDRDHDDDDDNGDHNDDDDDCGTNNNATSTPPTPDTTAPVISGLNNASTTSSSTIISWNTNESANGKIWFSTSTPINTALTPSASTSTLSLSHQFEIFNLTASNTYYYVVGSADASNNSATSTEVTLTTPAAALTQ